MLKSSDCHGAQWSVFSCSFLNLSEDFRQSNCVLPLRVDRPTWRGRNSRYITSFTEETGDHLLRSASSANKFGRIWLVFKDAHGRLLFCYGLNHGSYKRQISLSLVLSDCQIVRGLTRTNLGQVFMQYWMYVGGRNAQGYLYLTVCARTILHYHGINDFTTTVLGRSTRTSVGHDWIY